MTLSRPPRALTFAAVTGTNGKTTTASMIAAILAAAGERTALVTTLGVFVDGQEIASGVVPDGALQATRWAREHGARCVVVEATSKGLAQGFGRGLPIRIAVCTNVTRDHLDVHGTFEAYRDAKAKLFSQLLPGAVAVLNAGDDSSRHFAAAVAAGVRVTHFAADPKHREGTELSAARIETAWSGTRVELYPSPLAEKLGDVIELRVVSRVNAENALAAALAADALGLSPESIRSGLQTFPGVSGRFERIIERPNVVIDYAHTPDALQRCLQQAAELAQGARLFVVFGCGGERDTGKRAEMGAIAARLADTVWITNDNPRREDPQAIAAQIEEGARRARGPEASGQIHVCLDRRQAIENALSDASPSDVVVIAGKGHERVQSIDGENVPFSDADVARAATVRQG